MKTRSWPLGVVTVAGLLLLGVGERIFEAGQGRTVSSGLGVALIVASGLLRFMRSRSAKPGAKEVETALFGLQLVVFSSVVLYFAQSDVMTKISTGADKDSLVLQGILAALWPVVMLAGVIPQALMEISYASMAMAPQVETGRVRAAMYGGLGLAAAFTFAFATQYVVSERDVKGDFSYFRTTKPGEATRKLVASLDEPVTATLFFPPANDVADQVAEYFTDLKAASPKLTVERLDHALEPTKARDLNVSGNGVVVISRKERKESLYLGTDLEKARSQLRGLDQDVLKKLLQVATAKKSIYLTSGHGERLDSSLGGVEQRAAVEMLRNELKQQNYELKSLSSAEGLGSEVPKDAAAVMVLGPRQSFTAAEAKSLADYGLAGGKLFYALDPEAGLEFKELLEPLGVKLTPVLLAHATAHGRKNFNDSDRTLLATRTFTSHPIVSNNGRNGYPMFFFGVGPIEELPMHPAELVMDMSIRTEPETWNDAVPNFVFDTIGAEKKQAWGVTAAISRKKPGNQKIEDELRAVVIGDSDAVADEILNVSKGNAYFVLDSLKWLLGDEALSGTVNEESDIPITRTRQQDVAWFYSTTLLAPMLVLGIGFFMRSRSKRAARTTGGKS